MCQLMGQHSLQLLLGEYTFRQNNPGAEQTNQHRTWDRWADHQPRWPGFSHGQLGIDCPLPSPGGPLCAAQRPVKPGLWLLDSTPDPGGVSFGISNPNDSEGLMDLISCGAHMVFLVTGRGNVVGSAVSPCIKITGNHQTFEKMKGDMDFDAGLALEKGISQKEILEQLICLVVETAGGKYTKGEKLGHKEFFIPYKYQEERVCFKNIGS